MRSILDKLSQNYWLSFVDDWYETLKLSPNFQWVQITLNKSYICFNIRLFVLNPVPLGLFMLFHISCSEMPNILTDHTILCLISAVFLSKFQVFTNFDQKTAEFSISYMHFDSILLDQFFLDLNRSNFNYKLIIWYFNESVIFRHDSSSYCYFLNFFGICLGAVGRVISRSALFIWKIDQSIGLIEIKN